MDANTRYASRPWESNEERLTTVALQATEADTAFIQSIRPPIPTLGYLPPRFGYGNREAITIGDVVQRLDQMYPPQRADYAGMRSGPGYSGTSFPSLGVM